MIPFVRNPYNYDYSEVSEATGLMCLDESLAVQSEREKVDINTIVRQFGLTGQLPDAVQAPQFGDFTDVGTYQEAMNAVIAADEAFMKMPADVRARFNNDAALFVEFCSDERNVDEMERLHLFSPEALERRKTEREAAALAAKLPPPA